LALIVGVKNRYSNSSLLHLSVFTRTINGNLSLFARINDIASSMPKSASQRCTNHSGWENSSPRVSLL